MLSTMLLGHQTETGSNENMLKPIERKEVLGVDNGFI
jgi:hypothetical protein